MRAPHAEVSPAPLGTRRGRAAAASLMHSGAVPDADLRTTVAYLCAALAGFAANSLLCRAALAAGSIDAGSFTLVRLLAGAATLIRWR